MFAQPSLAFRRMFSMQKLSNVIYMLCCRGNIQNAGRLGTVVVGKSLFPICPIYDYRIPSLMFPGSNSFIVGTSSIMSDKSFPINLRITEEV
jgi:hypothetical protein